MCINGKIGYGWQYTSTGKVSGITGNVDRDYFTKEIFLNDDTPIPEIQVKPENTESYITYRIKWGDTLSSIAKEYNITISNLVNINGITNPNIIYAGQTLKIPIVSNTNIFYEVKWGDTLSKIAKKYNTTVFKLVQINKIENPNKIYVGEQIQIYEKEVLDEIHDCSGHILYTIKWGDTLSEIAKKYYTTISKIAELNNIKNPNIIYAGHILRIYCGN